MSIFLTTLDGCKRNVPVCNSSTRSCRIPHVTKLRVLSFLTPSFFSRNSGSTCAHTAMPQCSQTYLGPLLAVKHWDISLLKTCTMHCLNLGLLWTCNGGTLTLSWPLGNFATFLFLTTHVLGMCFAAKKHMSMFTRTSGWRWCNMDSLETLMTIWKSCSIMHGSTTKLGAKLMGYTLGRVALRLVWSLGKWKYVGLKSRFFQHAHGLNIHVHSRSRSSTGRICEPILAHEWARQIVGAASGHWHLRWTKRCTEHTWRAKPSTAGLFLSGCWIALRMPMKGHVRPAQIACLANGWSKMWRVETVDF